MKREVLIVVDMQNDFVDGALGSTEAVAILDKVVDKLLRNIVKLFHVASYDQCNNRIYIPYGVLLRYLGDAMPFVDSR